MKLTYKDLQQFYSTVDNAKNVVYDDYKNVIAFEYMKYYGATKRTGKLIKVSLKSQKELNKSPYIYLDEQDFFAQIADNIEDIADVRLHCGKIYKYTLHGLKYKTDKTDTKKLFDFFEYRDFLRITRNRFWDNDEMLRNGYFSGLIGTNDYNIQQYQNNKNEYDLYDIDFNAAYPYCLKLPLPVGRFYTSAEWESEKDKHNDYMNFYHIQIKTIDTAFDTFVPPQPYIEYRDFDFLMQKTKSNMIVSAERLQLINKVYGQDTYIIKNTYYCGVKIYLKLAKFAEKLYIDLQKEKKKKNGRPDDYKLALVSLIGNFGRRDETRDIKRLRLVDNDIYKDVIIIDWDKAEHKKQQNYLPLAMVVNDITARRLLNLMIDKAALRLCYNTDGGVVAVKKGTKIATSESIGKLKVKKIYEPVFLHTSMLYNRPLIYDAAKNKCYNAKSIVYDKEDANFFYTEKQQVNTRKGFKTHSVKYKIVVEPYNGFDFRKNEILIRLQGNKFYKRLMKAAKNDIDRDILKSAAAALDKMQHPYDDLYNEIRHSPEIEEYTQIGYLEKFYK